MSEKADASPAFAHCFRDAFPRHHCCKSYSMLFSLGCGLKGRVLMLEGKIFVACTWSLKLLMLALAFSEP